MNRTMYQRQPTAVVTRAELAHMERIRQTLPRCRYCGGSMAFTPLERIVLVTDEVNAERVAHRRCAVADHAHRE